MILWYPDCSRRKRCDAKASGRKSADSLQLSAPSDFASPAENSLTHGISFWGQLSSSSWVRQGYKDLTVLTPNRTLWWACVVPEPPTRLANSFGPASQFAFLILLPLSPLTDLIPNKYLVRDLFLTYFFVPCDVKFQDVLQCGSVFNYPTTWWVLRIRKLMWLSSRWFLKLFFWELLPLCFLSETPVF